MLIAQIFEFEVRVPGPLVVGLHVNPETGYFHDNTKISNENFQVNYYFLLKYCTRHCALFFLAWAELLTKFHPKIRGADLC